MLIYICNDMQTVRLEARRNAAEYRAFSAGADVRRPVALQAC